jgi:hypothetical protein
VLQKLLFKTKAQPANNSNGHKRDEWHNMKVDRQMYSGHAKITNLVGEYLQTKEETRMEGRGG